MKPLPIMLMSIGALLTVIIITALNAINVYIHPPRHVSADTPESYSLKFETLYLTTEDDLKLHAWYIPSKNYSNNSIVVLHGYPFDKGNILGVVTFLHDRYNLLLMDFRAMGRSEGAISTLGHDEQLDVKSAVNFLKSRDEAVGIFGFSLGASTGLMALPDVKVKAMVADSPYASLPQMAEISYAHAGPLKKPIAFSIKVLAMLWPGVNIDKISAVDRVRHVQTPILIIHGKDDSQIPVDQARQIDAAAPNSELWIVDGDHADAYNDHGDEYEKRVRAFYARHMPNG